METPCSDSRCSKLLALAISINNVSRHQTKAFGELYWMLYVRGCELKVYRSYTYSNQAEKIALFCAELINKVTLSI